MRQMEICKKRILLSEETECTAVYYVTIDELTDTATGLILENYGVGVTLCERDETQIISNVTFSKAKILSLIDLLSGFLVTPVAVADVVDDWLCAEG